MNATAKLRQRPITGIHEIELSSVCNLACVYCPHPTLERAKAHMSQEVFERTLRHLAFYVHQGTQREVALTGIGEAILHPHFAEMARAIRAVIGDQVMTMSTNGIGFTDAHILACQQNRVAVFVSMHRPEVAAPTAVRLKSAGVLARSHHMFVDDSMDWAGQVDWHVSAGKSYACVYLRDGWSVVRQDGSVVACCMDAHGRYPLSSVNDEPGSWQTNVIGLCDKCHMNPPLDMLEAA